MEVVQINTFQGQGGAARAAERLHKGLLHEGDVTSKMYVRDGQGAENVVEYSVNRDILGRLRRRWRHERIRWAARPYQGTRPENTELFSDDRTPYGKQVFRQCPPADIVNLHWIADFVDVGCFLEFVSVPVVWTLHDMNAFTGGCHYNAGCERYQEACGQCPQLGSETEEDLSRAIWERKRTVYRPKIDEGRLQVVAPSEWLAEEARQSTLFSEASVSTIPYGLDHTTFKPRQTEGVRSALEIPSDHRIVLFVAQFASSRRKGFGLLTEALSDMKADNVTLLSVGTNAPSPEFGFPHRHLGSLGSDVLLSVFYSLADIFVIPSRQDNLPNTVLESLACGTPVVGFDTGGIPDMVRPNETGWLADTGSVRSLRVVLDRALSDEDKRRRMGDRARSVVEEEYTLEIQAQAYRALYEELLAMHERPST